MKSEQNKDFNIPYIEDLDKFMCSKYARLLAKGLSGVEYVPAHAWELGEKNSIVAELDGDLENYVDLMTPKKSIVIFHNPLSLFNKSGRIGTHAGLFLGEDNGEIMIAEQRGKKQRVVSYKKMQSKRLNARLIVGPKEK